MTEVSQTRDLLDAIIAAFAMLGGTMAYFSGFAAAQAEADGEPPVVVNDRINEGIAEGFRLGAPFAVIALIIAVWA
jgi:hypothetical protein